MNKKRNFSFYLTSQIMSNFSVALLIKSIELYLMDLTGSSVVFSISSSLNLLAKALFLQLSGVAGDLFGKRKLFVFTDLFYATIAAILIISLKLNSSSVALLIVIPFILGAFFSIRNPIEKSLIPYLADKRSLVKANSAAISFTKLAGTLGPLLSFYIYSFISFKASVAFVLALTLTSFYLRKSITIKEEKVEINSKREILNKIRLGFKSIFKDRAVFLLFLNAVITQLLFHPFVYSYITIFVRDNIEELDSVISILNLPEGPSWKLVSSIFQTATVLGILISFFLIKRFKDNKDNVRKFIGGSIYIASSIAVVVASLFIAVRVTNLNVALFFVLVLPLLTLLSLTLNIFTVFFSAYYQAFIAKNKLGMFIANMLSIFAISGAIGTAFYGYIYTFHWALPAIFMSIGALVKVVLFKTTNIKEIEE